MAVLAVILAALAFISDLITVAAAAAWVLSSLAGHKKSPARPEPDGESTTRAG